MSRRSTARDIALAAGVSSASVDRILNERGGVSPEKEKAVIEAARRMRPDRQIRCHARRTLRVGVLRQPPRNPFHALPRDAFAAANRIRKSFNIEFSIFPEEPTALRNIYLRIAEAIDAGRRGDEVALAGLLYPGIKDGTEAIRWLENCVRSAEAGLAWVDFE